MQLMLIPQAQGVVLSRLQHLRLPLLPLLQPVQLRLQQNGFLVGLGAHTHLLSILLQILHAQGVQGWLQGDSSFTIVTDGSVCSKGEHSMLWQGIEAVCSRWHPPVH